MPYTSSTTRSQANSGIEGVSMIAIENRNDVKGEVWLYRRVLAPTYFVIRYSESLEGSKCPD